MLARCIGEGVKTAGKNWGLTILFWFLSLILAAIAAFPAWYWLGHGFDLAPESDRLLSGFNFQVFGELAQYDRSPVRGVIFASSMGVILLAILANPFIAGGLLESLIRPEGEATLMERFWRGAGRHFWRFLRLILYALVTAIPIVAAINAIMLPLITRLNNLRWEPGVIMGPAINMALLLLISLWLLLALDFARIRTACEDGRKTFRYWLSSLLFVWRHPLVTFGLIGAMALFFLLVAGLYKVLCGRLAITTWTAILFIILFQQAVMLVRSGLRVSLVAGELAFYRQTAPPPSPAPAVPEESTATELPSPEALPSPAQDLEEAPPNTPAAPSPDVAPPASQE